MNWLSAIPVIAQIIAMLVKNYFEKDTEEKARKKALHDEASEAIKSRDINRITAVFDKLCAK